MTNCNLKCLLPWILYLIAGCAGVDTRNRPEAPAVEELAVSTPVVLFAARAESAARADDARCKYLVTLANDNESQFRLQFTLGRPHEI